jgi:glycerol dehydrogenase-like iron-containing ADH family enzyme
MDLRVGTRVRFLERYRPPQVRWEAIGVIVDSEVRCRGDAPTSWVRARFGDFISPWVEVWQLERVS